MRFYMLWIGCLLSVATYAQTDSLEVANEVDTHYLEDQFYLGITYNWLISKPDDIKQHSFSRGLFGGYQRDIPLNKARNIGLAAGVGLSYQLTYINLKAQEGVMAYCMTSYPLRTNISKRIITNSMPWISL